MTDLPDEETEEAEECVHEADIVRDVGDDGLLAVWTHGLHRRGLKHLPLQYGHSGGGTGRSQDGRRVSSHVDEVTGTRTHVSRHRLSKVSRRRWVGATCQERMFKKFAFKH